MESDPLKPTPPADAAFDSWLRTHAALTPLRDAGFSSRVIAALPAPKPRVSPRLLAVALGALGGAGFAAFKISTTAPGDYRLPSTGFAFELLTQPTLHVTLAVTILSLGYAFRRSLRRWIPL